MLFFKKPKQEVVESNSFLGKRVWAIGGGKGGIGKSIISVNLGVHLAKSNHRVILIDADLGAANLHLCLGIKYPQYTLNDFLINNRSMDEILLDTGVENLKLISGASDILTLANPNFLQKQKFIKTMLTLKADYLIIDLGAGTGNNVLDFFAISNYGLVVMSPDPTSIENAYGFLKNAIIRKLVRDFSGNKVIQQLILNASGKSGRDKIVSVQELIQKLEQEDQVSAAQARESLSQFRPRLVLNMLRSRAQTEIANKFKILVKQYLDITIDFAGFLLADNIVRRSVEQMTPFYLNYARSKPGNCITELSRNIIKLDNFFDKQNNPTA